MCVQVSMRVCAGKHCVCAGKHACVQVNMHVCAVLKLTSLPPYPLQHVSQTRLSCH